MKMNTFDISKLLFAGLAVCAVTLSSAKDTGQPALSAYSNTVNSAKSLQVTCLLQGVSTPLQTIKIVLAKPDKVRIDTPEKLIIADGTNITTFLKAKNEYYTAPESANNVGALLPEPMAQVLAPFFNASALNPAPASQDLGPVSLNGSNFEKISLSNPASQSSSTNLFIDQNDHLVKIAQFLKSGDSSSTRVLNMKDISVNGSVNDSDFSFTPPQDAKKISIADLNSAKWYTSLSDAEQAASASGRKVFIDFFATWCGPCHMLENEVLSTEKFKELSKYFVFCKIDVDAQPQVASQYNITAMPTQIVADSNGKVIGQTVGYGGPAAFYQFIDQYIPN